MGFIGLIGFIGFIGLIGFRAYRIRFHWMAGFRRGFQVHRLRAVKFWGLPFSLHIRV